MVLWQDQCSVVVQSGKEVARLSVITTRSVRIEVAGLSIITTRSVSEGLTFAVILPCQRHPLLTLSDMRNTVPR